MRISKLSALILVTMSLTAQAKGRVLELGWYRGQFGDVGTCMRVVSQNVATQDLRLSGSPGSTYDFVCKNGIQRDFFGSEYTAQNNFRCVFRVSAPDPYLPAYWGTVNDDGTFTILGDTNNVVDTNNNLLSSQQVKFNMPGTFTRDLIGFCGRN